MPRQDEPPNDAPLRHRAAPLRHRAAPPGEWRRGPSRRALLRLAIASAAAAALAACSRAPAGAALSSPARQAAPTPAHGVITLSFQPFTDAYGFPNPQTLSQLLRQTTSSFLAKHPGVRLRLYGSTVNPLAAVIAGSGPDVPQLQGGGGGISSWLAGPAVLDLTRFVKQANVDLTAFAQGQLADVTRHGRLYGIPNYTGTAGVVVNQSALDQLGLAYPPPDWTYTQWAQLAASASGVVRGGKGGGQHRYGTTINADYFGNGPGAFYYRGWGAHIVDPANPARCALGSPQAMACAEFLYGLVWNKVAQFGWVPPGFLSGLVVAPFCWLQSYIIPAATQWRGFKWDFWPQPVWPQGSFTMTNPNFFALSAGTKHPDAAWELLHWLTVDPTWQRALMRTVLLPPGYLPLWHEWTTVVAKVAPPLAGKNLAVFAQHVKTGIMYGGTHFAHADPQAKGILKQWYGEIAARKYTVQEGFPQMARQIDALQQTAAVESGLRSAATRAFPAKGPAIAAVTPGR